MGAWGTGPFDNDHAADFASQVQGSSGPGSRQDLFAITFGAFTDMPDTVATCDLLQGYELPAIFEEVVASAAYISDSVNGCHMYTDSVYARGLDDDDRVAPHVDIGTPSPELVAAARVSMSKVVHLLRRASVGMAWIDYPERIHHSLVDRL